jgi:diguanylate cyclase (GGDEF)-like protein/PAS domain S-box-containing protein
MAARRDPFLSYVVGALLVLGGILVLASLLLQHPGGSDDAVLRAIGAGMLLVGTAYVALARRASRRLAFVTVAAFSATVSAAIYFSGVAAGLYSTMFIWVVLVSACFFAPMAALAQVGWLLACYAVVLSSVDDSAGFSPLTRWLLSAFGLCVAGGVTTWLVARRKATAERADQFFALSRDMLCTANREGYFVELNPAWTRVLRYSPAELRARPFIDFVHPDDRKRTIAESSHIFAGHETVHFQNRYRSKDGSWHWLEWSAAYSRVQDLIYARATDVTNHKRLESERASLVETLRSEARRDALTNLPNRRWLAEELHRDLARARRQDFPLCAAIIDLDCFKQYNDRHGHPAGDRLLRESAHHWVGALRTSDFMARYGGEEFVVLLPDCSLAIARVVIERVREATPSGQTCSAGIAAWEPGESAEQLIARADAALYSAKQAGRNRTAITDGGVIVRAL